MEQLAFSYIIADRSLKLSTTWEKCLEVPYKLIHAPTLCPIIIPIAIVKVNENIHQQKILVQECLYSSLLLIKFRRNWNVHRQNNKWIYNNLSI